jgi:hypothetical protein
LETSKSFSRDFPKSESLQKDSISLKSFSKTVRKLHLQRRSYFVLKKVQISKNSFKVPTTLQPFPSKSPTNPPQPLTPTRSNLNVEM